jgi:hypothetical protein
MLGALWLFSLVLVAWIAIELARPRAELRAISVVPLVAGTAQTTADSAPSELDSLRAENESLRAQLDAARNATLRQALAELLRQARESAKGDRASHVPGAGTVFTRLMDGQRQNKGMLGDLDGLIRAIAAFARMGDKGVDFLLEAANDDAHYSEEERHAAEEILAVLPHPQSMKYFLDKLKSDVDEADSEDPVYWQVRSLSTEDLAPFSSELNIQASQLMARGDADLLCALGLLHGDPIALQQLRDPQTWAPESFVHVIFSAKKVHTDEAHEFLLQAERMHKDVGTREQISQVLENW